METRDSSTRATEEAAEPLWGADRVQPTEGMRHLPEPVQQAMLERKRQTLERVDTWGPVVQRRARLSALAWGVLCPVLLILAAAPPLSSLLLATGLGAAAGYWTGIRRSRPTEHGLVIALVCMFCQSITGSFGLNSSLVFTGIFYMLVGAIGGVHHALKASDGQ